MTIAATQLTNTTETPSCLSFGCNDGRALEHAVKHPPRAPPAWFNPTCLQRSAFDVQAFIGLPDISNAVEIGPIDRFQRPAGTEPARLNGAAQQGSGFNVQILI